MTSKEFESKPYNDMFPDSKGTSGINTFRDNNSFMPDSLRFQSLGANSKDDEFADSSLFAYKKIIEEKDKLIGKLEGDLLIEREKLENLKLDMNENEDWE